ncbi:MAG: putative PEP-binding protein [Hyphomicrobiales bacterium]
MSADVIGFGQSRSGRTLLATEHYGAKSERLAAMATAGLRIAPSVALPISACTHGLNDKGELSTSFQVEISRGVRGLQRTTRKWLGDKEDPLILVVRISPVMAQGGFGLHVLHVGWTLDAIEHLSDEGDKQHASRQFADTIREIAVQSFGVDEGLFDDKLDIAEQAGDVDWHSLLQAYLEIAKGETDDALPLSPSDQLLLIVQLMWKSWNKTRALTYRQLYNIEDAGGLGIVIQVCVPWNYVQPTSTGWIAIRDENTGESCLDGQIFDHNGSSQPIPISKRKSDKVIKDIIGQATLWEMKSAQTERLDFIIAGDEAYIVDGTALPMTTAADVTVVVEMARAGAISKEEAVKRIDPARLIDILHARLAVGQDLKELAHGLSASPGAATGRVVFSASAAEALKSKGWRVILVRAETAPEDIRGMQASSAIVTTKGGLTSHAAVIARGTGKPCIVSMSGIMVNEEAKSFVVDGKVYEEGDHVTVDGSTGMMYDGKCSLRPSEVSGDLSTLLEWADEFRRMKVLTNVESPLDAEVAVRFGAEGIGLCRTEHMLFEPDRLAAMRQIILAKDDRIYLEAVARLVPLLRKDFVKLFEVMRDRPTNIRLFDPPLHEFLPKTKHDIQELAKTLGIKASDLEFTIDELSETNPMLGNRGCRLLICNPELAKTLVEVIFEAAIEINRKYDIDVKPEIMVPLVALNREFIAISRLIDDAAQIVEHKHDYSLHYKVGSMIELPRAAMIADRIASEADFFSFGTNDLTQTTFGISRDDAVAFLTTYEQMGLMENDPFVTIDEEGVGAVIEMTTIKGREANPHLEIGICGEHGGDPRSIHFCERLALDYVSCSPFRVPIARLAAAQATLSYR